MRVVAEHGSNPPRHGAQLDSLRVGGLPPFDQLLGQAAPASLGRPHLFLDELVPGGADQAAGLQVLRVKEKEDFDKARSPSSICQQSAHEVFWQFHLQEDQNVA